MNVKEVIEAVELVKNSLTGYEIIEDGNQEARLILKDGEQDLIDCYGDKEVVKFWICDKVGRKESDLFLLMVLKKGNNKNLLDEQSTSSRGILSNGYLLSPERVAITFSGSLSETTKENGLFGEIHDIIANITILSSGTNEKPIIEREKK